MQAGGVHAVGGHGRVGRRALRRHARGDRPARTSPSCRACRCCSSAWSVASAPRPARWSPVSLHRRPAPADRRRPVVREHRPRAARHDGHRPRSQPQRHRPTLREALAPLRRRPVLLAGTLVGVAAVVALRLGDVIDGGVFALALLASRRRRAGRPDPGRVAAAPRAEGLAGAAGASPGADGGRATPAAGSRSSGRASSGPFTDARGRHARPRARARAVGGGRDDAALPLLEVPDVTVRFGGHLALDDVSLDRRARPGDGPDRPQRRRQDDPVQRRSPACWRRQRGRVRLGGEDVTGLAPYRRARRGLARTFQRLELFGLLTVRENVELAASVRRRRARRAPTPDRGARPGGAVRPRPTCAPTSCPPARPAWSSWPGRWPPAPGCCCSTSRRRARTTARPRRSATSCCAVADEGIAVVLVEHDVQLVMRTCATHPRARLRARARRRARPTRSRPTGPCSTPTWAPPRSARDRVRRRRRRPRPPARRLVELRGVRAAYGPIEVLHGVDLGAAAG